MKKKNEVEIGDKPWGMLEKEKRWIERRSYFIREKAIFYGFLRLLTISLYRCTYAFFGVLNTVYLQKPHLQQFSRRGIYVTTCKILLLFIIYISLSNYLVLILIFYTIPVPLHDVTNFLNHKTLPSKHVSIFHCENMTSFLNYITATLRALFTWRGSFYYRVVNQPASVRRTLSKNYPLEKGVKSLPLMAGTRFMVNLKGMWWTFIDP